MGNNAYESAQIGYDDDAQAEYILKKDIVIPAGTRFTVAPTRVERYGTGHVEALVGLTDDSCGSMSYFVDPDDPALFEWFEHVDA